MLYCLTSMAESKFNWSLLDREGITDYLLLLSPQISKSSISKEQFHSIISKHLKKLIPIRFRQLANARVKENFVWVGGTYYSDWDQEHKKCIELSLVYSTKYDSICMPKQRFRTFCRAIADTILHELIHMRQYRRRKFKIIPDYASTAEKTKIREEQSYLGCSDEIDAYGFNIACELVDKFGKNKKSIASYLNENQKGMRRKANSWTMYLRAFQHDHQHPIIRRVKKKVIRYLPQAFIGKPYRNKDWINC